MTSCRQNSLVSHNVPFRLWFVWFTRVLIFSLLTSSFSFMFTRFASHILFCGRCVFFVKYCNLSHFICNFGAKSNARIVAVHNASTCSWFFSGRTERQALADATNRPQPKVVRTPSRRHQRRLSGSEVAPNANQSHREWRVQGHFVAVDTASMLKGEGKTAFDSVFVTKNKSMTKKHQFVSYIVLL